MLRFFPNIIAIHAFTLALKLHVNQLCCASCHKSTEFVSHGFVYKQRSQSLCEPIGKRILCSARYGRSGCGRTHQIYIATEIPARQYNAQTLLKFLTALLSKQSVVNAYQQATGKLNTRHAWRWLNQLITKLPDYRMRLSYGDEVAASGFKSRSRRLQWLLPTIALLFSQLEKPLSHISGQPCATYQASTQMAFF